MRYCHDRRIWMNEVGRANKDNPAVKKGEPYIRVRKDRFAKVEYFKDIEELDMFYPIPTFKEKYGDKIDLLNLFKRELAQNPNLTGAKFLRTQGYS